MSKLNTIFQLTSFFLTFILLGDDKRFIIDICSYNNAQWYQENLASVFNQEYDNYHIIYTDDASTDGTSDLVETFVRERGVEDKITIIRNKKRRRQLANHWRVVQLCDPQDVIVVLDGDDWLAHEKVLSKVNTYYTTHNAWITYGQYKNWPIMRLGYCHRTPPRTIAVSNYRRDCWYWGHLRTYYAWLAQQVRLEDLILDELKDEKVLSKMFGPRIGPGTLAKMKEFHGKFFPASADASLGYPMLEMAGDHLKFISSVVYMRNVKTNMNTYKTQPVQQQYSARYVRAKPKYKKIAGDATRYKKIKTSECPEVAMFFQYDQVTLDTFMGSADKFLKNVKHLFIFYDKQVTDIGKPAPRAPDTPKVTLIDVSASYNLTQAFDKNLGTGGYVLCVRGNELLKSKVDLAYCADMLDRTFAHAFYIHPVKFVDKPVYEWTGLDDVCCWPFKVGDLSDKHHPTSLSMSLYRKQDLLDLLKDNKVQTLKDLDGLVSDVYKTNKIGLFFYQPS